MKTVICPPHLKPTLYHQLCAGKGFVTDVSVQSLSTLFHIPQNEEALLLLQGKQTLQAQKEKFPIYRDMFSYTAFIQELLTFAKTCALFGIRADQLPTRTKGETELREILSCLLPSVTYEQTLFQKREEIKQNILHISDLSICAGFEKNFFLYNLQKELIKADVPTFTPHIEKPKSRLLHTALNMRQEAEAVVQNICKSMQSSNIVLCSYHEQFPVLQQILERYHVPYSCIDDMDQPRIYTVFHSLIKFALEKDISSFLQILDVDGFSVPCPDAIYTWLHKVMQSSDLPSADLNRDININSFAKEKEKYLAAQKEAESYMQKIDSERNALRQAETPQDILKAAYAIIMHHPFIEQDKERAAALSIHSFLQSVLEEVHDDEDVAFINDFLLTQARGKQRLQGDFVTVTDLAHPVDAQKRTYVLHTDSLHYPGFNDMRGLFDEDYVGQIEAFPSLSDRYTAYMNQLEWIEHSASDILSYSCPLKDYQGRPIQFAYDITTTFEEEMPKKWVPDQPEVIPLPEHTLSPETATALFAPDGVIEGSVSAFERWFSCPFSFFIQVGLHVAEGESYGMDSATFGNIQHALMQKAVDTFGKQYAEKAPDCLEAWLQDYMKAMISLSPNEAFFIRHTFHHLHHAMLRTFHILASFERNTSFEPKETEKKFEKEEIVKGVEIRGSIDRIDFCHDQLFRIIDYKSSKKLLSQSQIMVGLQLQLLTYLLIADHHLYKDKKPTAAFYFSLKGENFIMPAITLSYKNFSEPGKDEKWLSENELKNRRLRGWTFDKDHVTEQDSQGDYIVGLGKKKVFYNYSAVEDYMQDLYLRFHDRLLSGDIRLEPVKNACTFCAYRPICRFQGEVCNPTPFINEKKDVDFEAKKIRRTSDADYV